MGCGFHHQLSTKLIRDNQAIGVELSLLRAGGDDEPFGDCVKDAQTGTGAVSRIPRDERLEPILAERKAKAERQRLAPGAYDIACPDCAGLAGERCASPSGGVHRSRVEGAQKAGQEMLRSEPEPGPVD
ncbi:hypothetical protein [Streptomyces lutosisoli]|uniref:Uncharacterized protein n=1 Tax=Streptomyces lutosisoli TaxID=2665721 RepID=A0ABW2VU70_9ACTN